MSNIETADNPASAKGYRTDIYNMKGSCVLTQDFELEYTDIHFLSNNLLCIRNERQCMLYTMRGKQR